MKQGATISLQRMDVTEQMSYNDCGQQTGFLGMIKKVKPLAARDCSVGAEEENRLIPLMLKGAFHIATQISSFDLKLSFFGKEIRRAVEDIRYMSTGVASASEEISTSTAQIVNANAELYGSIDRIAHEAALLRENTGKSSELLLAVKQENADMQLVSQDMEKSVYDLLTVIEKINDAVKSINKISDQTKLLSLNASIEAARAGEAGKGFAVVAEEIRSLSGTTKALTTDIGELLHAINDASNRSKASVEKTACSILSVSGSIQAVSDITLENVQTIGNISERLTSVSATSKEINDSLQESSTALESVNSDLQTLTQSAEELEQVSNSIHEVSAAMGDIEGHVNEVAVLGGKIVNSRRFGLSNDDFVLTVDNAVKAHKVWVLSLKEMAKTMKLTPTQTDEHKCGFGHFYYAVKPCSPQMVGLWEGIEKLHHDLHKKGESVIGFVNQNDSRQAMQAAGEAEQLSAEIIGTFEKMILLAKQMSRSGEAVF